MPSIGLREGVISPSSGWLDLLFIFLSLIQLRKIKLVCETSMFLKTTRGVQVASRLVKHLAFPTDLHILLQVAERLMTIAYESGVNLFDTAEVYAAGK